MPTIVTHGVIAVALGRVAFRESMPVRFWLLCILCAMLPDIDVAGFSLGIKYGDLWGHRGMTHSLLFALVTALLVVAMFFPQKKFRRDWLRLFLLFFLVTASHGLFDAMTNGGRGIAFFSPFDTTRYFLPFTPLQVSYIGLESFVKIESYKVIIKEMEWLGLPTLFIFTVGYLRYFLLQKQKTRAE